MFNNFFFKYLFLLAILLFLPFQVSQAQNKDKDKPYKAIGLGPFESSAHHWYDIYDKGNIINPLPGRPRYTPDEITKIADNILLLQRNNGGWPKNYDVQAILTDAQKDSLVKTKNILHTTFDNSTTFTQIEYLARVYTLTHIKKYKEGCLKGITFTLSAQYANGGWPQYYPLEEKYSRCITFNDGAYVGIMNMLKDVLDGEPYYSFIPDNLRSQIKTAWDKGLDCILKCQIVDKGKLTAWCQQHNEVDLSPAWARKFEPPSICNGESAPIVLLLMSIDHPSPEIIHSVQAAVKWFEDSKILDTRVDIVKSPQETSQWRTYSIDKVVVTDSTAPPIWTRYYELGTERPLFCDRNSKFLYSLAEVSHERRAGYGWYTYAPQEVLDKYLAWKNQWIK